MVGRFANPPLLRSGHRSDIWISDNIWSEYYHSLCLDYAIAEFKALI